MVLTYNRLHDNNKIWQTIPYINCPGYKNIIIPAATRRCGDALSSSVHTSVCMYYVGCDNTPKEPEITRNDMEQIVPGFNSCSIIICSRSASVYCLYNRPRERCYRAWCKSASICRRLAAVPTLLSWPYSIHCGSARTLHCRCGSLDVRQPS